MTFHTGPNEEADLTDGQILTQCKMYIAAVRIADDFGCDLIGIQYQQGLKDLLPASDLVEGMPEAMSVWLTIFACWPAPGSPWWTMVLPMRSKQGRRASTASGSPPIHDGKPGFAGAYVAAGDGRVEAVHALFGGPGGNLHGLRGLAAARTHHAGANPSDASVVWGGGLHHYHRSSGRLRTSARRMAWRRLAGSDKTAYRWAAAGAPPAAGAD